MMKKTVLLAAFLALALTALVSAQEESGGPAASLSFTQEVDTGIVDNESGGNYLTDGDTLYLSTEMVAGIAFELGTVTVSPWLAALYETGDGGSVSPDNPYQLGTASLGIDSAFAVSDPFNVYFKVGMYWEVAVGDELVPYLVPVLGFEGALDSFFYDVSEKAKFYFKDEGLDIKLTGNYEAGYELPAGLVVTLADELIFELDMLDGDSSVMDNNLSLVLSGSLGPFAPYAGGVFDLETVDGETEMMLIGFTAGADITVEAWSFGLCYTGGKDLEGDAMIGAFSAVLGLEL